MGHICTLRAKDLHLSAHVYPYLYITHVLIQFAMGGRPPNGVGGDGFVFHREPGGVLNSHHDVDVSDIGNSLIDLFKGDIAGENRQHARNRAHLYQSKLLTIMLDRMKGMEEPRDYNGSPFYFVFHSLNNCVKGYKILYFVMDRIESLPPERRNGVLAALHMTIRDISFRLDSIVCGNYVRRVGAEDAEPDAHNGDAGPLMPSPDDIESCFNSVNDILDACAGKLG